MGLDPEPYLLEYELATAEAFITRTLTVRTQGRGWRRSLTLTRNPNGSWTADATADGETDLRPPGGDTSAFEGAVDCDLGRSRLANSTPVLRHRLLRGGGPVDFLMAWVSVPDLSVDPSGQRYTFVRHEGDLHVVRYEARGGSFVADITFDDDGLVVTYPELATRAA